MTSSIVIDMPTRGRLVLRRKRVIQTLVGTLALESDC